MVTLAAMVWAGTGVWVDGGTPREAVARLHDWAAYLGIGALVVLASLALAGTLDRSRRTEGEDAPRGTPPAH